MYWKLEDKISGMKWESNFKYQIMEIISDLIEDYKQQGMETYATYQQDGLYWLDEYPIKLKKGGK